MQSLAFFPLSSHGSLWRSGLLLMLVLFPLLDGIRSATPGQERAGRRQPRRGKAADIPFSNPQEFMEKFLGKETAEDRQALENVPISPKDEQRIGSEMLKGYLAELEQRGTPVLQSGKEVEYLRKLVELIRPQLKNHRRYRQIDIYLADGSQTDARSFPGGSLVFFRGMLDFAESEAALVGVVGHELSHLDHGHQLGPAKRMKLAQQGFSGQGGNFSYDKMMQSGALMMRTFARPFHPEEEAEADADGVRWCYRAGYDPRQMADLFLRLHRRDGVQAAAPFNFFQTHPYHRDRYEAVLRQDRDLQRGEPRDDLYIGRTNLERRINRDEQRFPE